MTKEQIRYNQKLQRNALSAIEHTRLCSSIRETLFQTDDYHNCEYFFAFISFQSEVDTREIIKRALLDGKRVYAPKVETHGMEFYEINNFEVLLASKYGVPEPLGGEETLMRESQFINRNNLMLFPGLAFDKKGNRIGYGAGYYDQYLSKYSSELFNKMALAFDFQVIENIIAEEHDVKADLIITPTKVIQCK